MAVNICEERILEYQQEYPFLLEIGYSLRKAKDYFSELTVQIRKEKGKNKQAEVNKRNKKKNQKEKFFSKKRKKPSIEPKQLKPVDQVWIDELKLRKQVLVNYLRYLKRYYKIQKQIELENRVLHGLTNKQQLLFHQAMNNQFEDFRLCDFYAVYCYTLEQNHSHQVLANIVNELEKKYAEGTKEQKEEIASYFERLRQQTKNYLLKLENKDKFLKDLFKQLQDYCKLHETLVSISPKPHNPFEDFLKLLLESENSYTILEKLLYRPQNYRDIVNFRDSEGNHILFLIQNYLLNSCRLELINQTSDYTSKEYYKKIWQLFINHPSLSISEEEKEILKANEQIFIEEMQTHHYKKGPSMQQFIYDLAKEESKDSIPCPETFSPCYYGDYHDLTEEYTFSFDQNDRLEKAYSIQLTDQGTFKIKVHVVDVSETILDDSPLDAYLKDKMFKMEDFIPDKISKPYIYLQQDKKEEQPFLKEYLYEKRRPVITYQIEINDKGQIVNFDVYQSMVVVNQVLPYDIDLQACKKDDIFNSMYYLYFALYDHVEENVGKKIEDTMLSFVKKAISKSLCDRNLPMIYRVQGQRDDETYLQYMKDSSYLFGKMDIDEAHFLHDILREDSNYAYLSAENIGHFSLQDSFCIPLFHPCDSYIDLTVQRLLKIYFLSKGQVVDTESLEQLVQDVSSLANQKLDEIRFQNRVKKFIKK